MRGGPTAAGSFTDSISWTPQFRAAMTYVAGAHSLKVGFNDTYLKAHDSNLINTTGYQLRLLQRHAHRRSPRTRHV